MTVYGLSQSNGVERVLEIDKSGERLLLHIHDDPEQPREKILVAPAEVVSALTDGESGARTIEGASPQQAKRKLLDIEVRGNEVLLWVRPETGAGWDIAVGLDDFQDAVEAAS
jgi:hypothetical protein